MYGTEIMRRGPGHLKVAKNLGCCSPSCDGRGTGWPREQKGCVQSYKLTCMMEPGQSPWSPGLQGGCLNGERPFFPGTTPQNGKHGFERGDTDISLEEP